jgi:phosphatidate cytidylyltransferase
MADSAQAPDAPSGTADSSVKKRSDLPLRIVSSLVLVPLVIGITYVGGWPFALLWGAAAIGIWFEWSSLVSGGTHRPALLAGGLALIAATAFAGLGRVDLALIALVLGIAVASAVAKPGRRVWTASGMIYAAAALLGPVVLRHDMAFGFAALLLLYAVVWATDIGGYFGGRAFGGPKLWRRVSPNKTWSGALSGTAAAVAAGLVVAHYGGAPVLGVMALIILVLSVVSQAGDLFESAIKRRFDAKDSGHILPGHGGLMDRLDGFLVAAAVAALIGLAHGGFAAPARGLMVW